MNYCKIIFKFPAVNEIKICHHFVTNVKLLVKGCNPRWRHLVKINNIVVNHREYRRSAITTLIACSSNGLKKVLFSNYVTLSINANCVDFEEEFSTIFYIQSDNTPDL